MSKEVENVLGLNIIYADLESVLPGLPGYYDPEDLDLLLAYYNREYTEANTRAIDDEVNGFAFSNLDYLKGILVNNGVSLKHQLSKRG